MKTNNFEVILVGSGKLTDEENTTTVEKFKEIITKNGGTVASDATWGRRKLAYEVAKEKTGIYNFLYITGTGETVKEMELQMGYDEQVIKYFVLAVKDLDKAKADFEALKEDPLKNAKLITEAIGA